MIKKHNSPQPKRFIKEVKSYMAPLENRRDSLRLDFNENTIGPSPKVIDAIKDHALNHIAIYPEYNGLKDALIENLNLPNISKNEIGLFNGVDAAINAIFNAYGISEKTFLTTTPTFGYYFPCAETQGMEICSIPYKKEKFNFPLEQFNNSIKNFVPQIIFISRIKSI